MAFPSYTYIFTNGSTADATQVNQNYTDILNGVTDTTKDLSVSAITAAGNVVLNGNVTLGISSSKTITFMGQMSSTLGIVANNLYDIGTVTSGGLRALYFSSAAASFTTKVAAQTTVADVTITLPASTGTLRLTTSNHAISSSSGAFVGGAGAGPTDITNLTVSITTTGNPIVAILVPDGSGNNGAIGYEPGGYGNIYLNKGGSVVANSYIESVHGVTSTYLPPGSVVFYDAPAAGTYTYKLQYSNNAANINVFWSKLFVYEL